MVISGCPYKEKQKDHAPETFPSTTLSQISTLNSQISTLQDSVITGGSYSNNTLSLNQASGGSVDINFPETGPSRIDWISRSGFSFYVSNLGIEVSESTTSETTGYVTSSTLTESWYKDGWAIGDRGTLDTKWSLFSIVACEIDPSEYPIKYTIPAGTYSEDYHYSNFPFYEGYIDFVNEINEIPDFSKITYSNVCPSFLSGGSDYYLDGDLVTISMDFSNPKSPTITIPTMHFALYREGTNALNFYISSDTAITVE